MMRRICPVQTVPVLSHRPGPNSIVLVLSACAHRRTRKHLYPTASTGPACALSQTNEHSNDALVRDPRRGKEKHTRRVRVRKCVCETDKDIAQEPLRKEQEG